MIDIKEINESSGGKKPSNENAIKEYFTIGDIIDMQSGVAFKKSEYSQNGVRLFQIANVSFNYIKWEEVEHLPENYIIKHPELLLNEGDIVMALNRPLLNDQLKIAQIKKSDTPAILYQRVGRFKFLIKHNPRYFLYFLQSPLFIKWLKEQLQGVNIPFINKSKLLGYNKYPKHTLDEQNSIVSKIEELFSELDKGIEELKTAQQQLKVYQQAVLKWAFEGRLTNEDVKDGELPEGWKRIQLKEACIIKRGKSKHRPRNEPSLFGGKYPFIQTGDIRNANGGYISTYSQTYSELGLQQSKLWPKGTLCITIAANIGETAILNFDACFPDSVVGLICNEEVLLNKYTNYFFISHKSKLEEMAPATAQKNINVEILEKVEIPIGTIEEQQQIVQEIESRLSVCDKIEETITNSLKQAEALRQSILKKAFEGKLTA
jgi:type I restriction enzyme, S subunit